MIDLIISGGLLITVDPERRVIENGAIAVSGGRIADIGPADDVLDRNPCRNIIDARGKAVLPGLIDVHAHAGHALIRTMGGDDLDAWEKACETACTVASDENFWFAEARLVALERLRFGVTTGVSLLGGGDTIMRTDDPRHADAHCRGVSGTGTRSVVAIGPTRPPHPRSYAHWTGETQTVHDVTYEDQLNVCRSIIESWHGANDDRITIALLTPALRDEHADDLTPDDFRAAQDQTREVHALSRDLGLLFTQDGHTTNSVDLAHELGILGPRTLLSHATDLTGNEMQLLAETDTKIAHNPSSNASVDGRCPAPELIDMGVTVGLGSDATAPDRSGDMFRHMQQTMHYHRRHFRDVNVLPPGKVLEMATIDAARALGMEMDIGSLETGKRADIITVDLSRPHLAPGVMPLYQTICFANGNDVADVIVGGDVLMRERDVPGVDEKRVVDDAQNAFETLLKRSNLSSLLEIPETFWGRSRY